MMPFEAIDNRLIATFGKDVVFTPSGSAAESARIILVDPVQLGNGALLVAFGTVLDSGFSRAPLKGDSFTIDGVTYHVFEVLGPDNIGGYHISLTK